MPRCKPFGPTNEQRHSNAALVDLILCASQTSIESLSCQRIGAVVAREDDDGVVGQSQIIDLRQQLTDPTIHHFDHGIDSRCGFVETLTSVPSNDLGRRFQRAMRSVVCEMQKERMLAVSTNKLDRSTV